MLDAIEFSKYTKKEDIYGTVIYPAVMVGPVQKLLLTQVLENKIEARIIDPFHGSGTALYEAFEINPDFELYGIDINPFANLITRAKLQGVDENILNDIEFIKSNLFDQAFQYSLVDFNNITKWFRIDIINDLSKIRCAIMQVKSSKNRAYFWSMMSNIIRKYSNSRSSTYKLHIKPQEKINNMKNNVINDFIASIEQNYRYYQKSSNRFKLFKSDTLYELDKFPDNYFEILITSPPYGDNATTVTYGQFSIIILYWIDKKDLVLDGWEFDNFSKIDHESLGGYYKNNRLEKYDKYINNTIERIHDDKKIKKVQTFFYDYFTFLSTAYRVVQSYIILTLGNRTVDGINIELTDFTKRFLDDCGMNLIYEGKRNIYSKRTPKILANNNGSPIFSMNEEYAVIFKK